MFDVAIKLNHLLFMDDIKLYAESQEQLQSLIKVKRTFSNDIKMCFGLKKCAVLIIRKGKIETAPEPMDFRSLQLDET